jgi:hypothetical protein
MARIDKKAGIVRFFRSVQQKMNSLIRLIYIVTVYLVPYNIRSVF